MNSHQPVRSWLEEEGKWVKSSAMECCVTEIINTTSLRFSSLFCKMSGSAASTGVSERTESARGRSQPEDGVAGTCPALGEHARDVSFPCSIQSSQVDGRCRC